MFALSGTAFGSTAWEELFLAPTWRLFCAGAPVLSSQWTQLGKQPMSTKRRAKILAVARRITGLGHNQCGACANECFCKGL